MDCPQCGGTLTTYALSGQEASVCEDCGYVGIPAEHRGEPARAESWDDALRRFYRAHGTDSDPTVELQPPVSRPRGGPSESWDDALRRFRNRQTNGEPGAAADDEAEADDGAAADETEPAESDVTGSSTGTDETESAKAETGTDADDAEAESASQPSQSSAGDS